MKKKAFAIIKGNSAKIDGDKIIYQRVNLNDEVKTEEDKNNIDPAYIRTNVNFSSGTIKLKFKATKHKTGVLIILKGQNGKEIVIGHSYDNEKFCLIDQGLRQGNVAGSLSNYDLNKEHSLVMTLSGSIANLYIDDVLILSDNIEIKDAPVELRLCSDERIEVYDFDVEHKSKNAFIVMQFTKEYDDLYTEVIKPVCDEFDIKTVRADEYYSSTPIISDIINSIRESALIIADITPDNPNVFYEIGYAHAIQKPVILLSDKKREKLPFDISSFRTIFYENSISGKKKVEEALRKYLKSMS